MRLAAFLRCQAPSSMVRKPTETRKQPSNQTRTASGLLAVGVGDLAAPSEPLGGHIGSCSLDALAYLFLTRIRTRADESPMNRSSGYRREVECLPRPVTARREGRYGCETTDGRSITRPAFSQFSLCGPPS
jgi:hypothetical protein